MYFWSLSRKSLNHVMHSLFGNGSGRKRSGKQGKQGKGKSDQEPKSDAQIFMEAMRDALPVEARMRAQTTLLQSEWSATVYPH